MNNLSKLDFTGQPIYIGLDVHKKELGSSLLLTHVVGKAKLFCNPRGNLLGADIVPLPVSSHPSIQISIRGS